MGLSRKTLNKMPKTWQAAEYWVKSGKRKIAPNTYVTPSEKAEGGYGIRHYITEIVTLFPDSIVVDVGPYKTHTTGGRINIFVNAHNWYMVGWKFIYRHHPYIFYKYNDGIRLYTSGKCIDYEGLPTVASPGKFGKTLKLDKWWVNYYPAHGHPPDMIVAHRHSSDRTSVPTMDGKCMICDTEIPKTVFDVALFKQSGLSNF